MMRELIFEFDQYIFYVLFYAVCWKSVTLTYVLEDKCDRHWVTLSLEFKITIPRFLSAGLMVIEGEVRLFSALQLFSDVLFSLLMGCFLDVCLVLFLYPQ